MYEVFLCASPTHFPLSFASHTWFVINEDGKFSRYEILFQKNRNPAMGYLHINTALVFEGLEIILFLKKPKWTGKILGTISGQLAQKIIETIKRSEKEYPHMQSYKLTGPNSNTYTQWILEKFPEWNIQLPWSAFGKK